LADSSGRSFGLSSLARGRLLRHIGARRQEGDGAVLAEIGCTEHEIAAITGHASIAEVQRYTKAADRKRLARSAMAKLIEGGS
jgi:integrase